MPQSILDKYRLGRKPEEDTSPTQSVLDKYRAGAGVEQPGLVSRVVGAVPEPVRNTVGTVLDILGRPGRATAGFVAGALSDAEGVEGSAFKRAFENLTGDREDDFDQVLAEQGFEDSLARNVAGFVGDLVLDPLNLVGVGAVGKALGKGARAVTNVAGDVVSRAPESVRLFSKAVKDALGEKFVPRYGTTLTPDDIARLEDAGVHISDPNAFRKDLRRFQRERSTIPTREEQKLIQDYAGTTEEFRRDVLRALDEGAGKTDEVDAAMLRQKAKNDELFRREVEAGVQSPEAYRPDYAPADYSRVRGPQRSTLMNPQSALNAKNRFARARKDPEKSIVEHIAAGAEPDVALAQLTRNIEGERSILTGNFLQKMIRDYSLPVMEAPDNWVTLKNIPVEKPLGKQLSEVAFPSYIAKQLDKVYEKPKEATILGKIYDKALQHWRSQATVLRPGFHFTNLQGNLFNGAFIAGALHPKRFLEAATWDKLKQAGFEGAPKIGRYTAQQVDEFMERFGVGGAGHSFTSELLEEGADEVLKAKLAGKKGLSKNPFTVGKEIDIVKHPLQAGKEAYKRTVRAGKHVGQTIEDFSKRALFFDRLHKGDTLEEASDFVDKFLFDYSDLTDFERKWMRRIIPFYTWMRKNVPLQAEQLVKQPHKYAAIEKTTHAIEEESKDRGTFVPEGDRAEFLQSQNAIQLPTDVGEEKKFLTPYLPYQDLNKIPIPGGSDALEVTRDILSGIDPITKAVIELSANKSLFFNRPIYQAELGPIEDRQRINDSLALLPDVVKDILFTPTVDRQGRPIHETPALVRYLASQFPLMESSGKAVRSITAPEDVTNPYNFLSALAGVRITERDKQQEAADRKANRAKAKRIKNAKRKQDRKPPKKAQVSSLYEKYLNQR